MKVSGSLVGGVGLAPTSGKGSPRPPREEEDVMVEVVHLDVATYGGGWGCSLQEARRRG